MTDNNLAENGTGKLMKTNIPRVETEVSRAPVEEGAEEGAVGGGWVLEVADVLAAMLLGPTGARGLGNTLGLR